MNLFEYRDGTLYCKQKIGYKHNPGDKAGRVNGDGYIHIWINNKDHKEHRLIFLMHHGHLPRFLDHIDMNRSNNKIENIREATCSQNQANKNLQKSNTSGLKGVNKHGKNRWVARVSNGRDRKYLGSFKTKEEAYEAYKKEAILIYGEFVNLT